MIEHFNELLYRNNNKRNILPTGRFPYTCYNGPYNEPLAQLEFKKGMFKKLDGNNNISKSRFYSNVQTTTFVELCIKYNITFPLFL